MAGVAQIHVIITGGITLSIAPPPLNTRQMIDTRLESRDPLIGDGCVLLVILN